MALDRISNLPSNVIDEILSHLMVKDAARTSLLSSKWRYKWAKAPSLVLNDETFPVSKDHQGITMINKLVSDIDRVLLLHSGAIHKFELSYQQSLPTADVDKWIFHLSGRSIKEFALKVSELEYYKMPSCMFSWQSLTRLDLINCVLRPPLTFKGFKNLKRLDLKKVTLDQDAFENLICSCPLLERLTLTSLDGVFYFNINAPNLKYFILQGDSVNASLKNTSRLALFSIHATSYNENYQNGDLGNSGNLIKLLSDILQIERLHIEGYSLLVLAQGDIPRELPVSYANLRHLSIAINFTSFEESLTFLCLLRSVPTLQELHIESCWEVIREAGGNVWEADQWNRPFTGLQHVEICYFRGLKAETDFINFMLLTSPVLTKMVVKLDEGDNNNWNYGGYKEKLEIVKQLLGFKRASTQARIILMDQ